MMDDSWIWDFDVLPFYLAIHEIVSRTEQGGCLGYSVPNAGLLCTKGVSYIYDWYTGLSILI